MNKKSESLWSEYKKKELPPLTEEEKRKNREINQLPLSEQFQYYWTNGGISFKISVFISIIFIIAICIYAIQSFF